MLRNSSRIVALVVCWTVIGVAGAARGADAPALPKMPDTTPPGKPHFDSTGAQVGEQLPDLSLYTLDGKKGLGALHGPALILTSSYSCPKSRSEYPAAAKLAEKFKGKIPTVFVYVIEAHPKGDPSPYSGVEDLTIENQRDHIFCTQPRTIAERIELAKKFQKRLEVSQPIFVDGMDNAVWKSLGGGPNMGFLIDENRIVLARQGWFDAKSMEAAVDAFRAVMPKLEQTENRIKSESFGWDDVRPTVDGDLEKVKSQLVASPTIVNKIVPYEPRGNEGDRALLHYAVAGKRLPVVEFLVSKGADVNLQTEHAPTPLHLAAKNGDVAIAKFLIDHGAKVNTKAQGHGPTPLQEALIHTNHAVAQLLVKSGATTNFFTDVASGNLDAIKKQLEDDPTIAIRPDGWNRPPLAYAAGGGQTEAAATLLASGAHDFPPSAYGGSENSAIWWAVHHQNVSMIRLLCKSGSTPNLLHDAVLDGSTAAVRELLAQKADPNQEDDRGFRPLHWAAIQDRLEIARLLIGAGADTNLPTGVDNGMCGSGTTNWISPLHFAASNGSREMITELLKHQAKINALDHEAKTSLQYAAASTVSLPKLVAAVKGLLEAGAEVNAKDEAGSTALDEAIKVSRTADKPDSSVVELLRARGAKAGSEVSIPNGVPPAECTKLNRGFGPRP